LNKKFYCIRVIQALGSHDLITLRFSWALEDCILYEISQIASKSIY